jgi:putative tricarboxylic transport membrane protein
MTIERAIAGIFILLCLIYGYTAFVSMEANLLPFELNMVFLPNTMPKWLSVLGVIVGLVVVIQSGPEASTEIDSSEIDYRNMRQYKLAQALFLLVLMVAYALLLRPIGFLTATTLFLAGGSIILGERRFIVLVPVAVITAVMIWYLVQEVLGIFLRPWPWFI